MASFDQFLDGESSQDAEVSNRMANIFAEDDEQDTIVEKPKPSMKIFSTTAFLSVENAQSIKCGLIVIKNDGKIYTILYDSSKKCIFRCELNQLLIESIDQASLSIKYDVPIENIHQKAKLTFIDLSDFTRYSALLFLHNNSKPFFILDSGGAGEKIEEYFSVLYDTVKYKMEQIGLSLPVPQSNIKSKLTPEKLENHPYLSNFVGLSKNAILLVKPDEENVVYQVTIRKIKAHTQIIESSVEPEDPSLLERISKIGKNVMPPPTTSQESKPTESLNLYEIIHRVVGVEIDRMEMRLNARLEHFETQVIDRLEKQNRLLESLVKRENENL
ncbi:unnamed protein product [Caenorhabditis angaria]|uniref:Uncharacterized protein n=1 Tax=Caenorhabditis angaria TaxID=860376 RepID=A0A9P1I4A8_9PELO|nr:unnamed protein product [Caenorhabditis angaria]